MVCERCNVEHDGKFATGRYCSRACANKRTYTPEKKKQVYQKVTQTLLTRNLQRREFRFRKRPCLNCGNEFSHYKNKTCSRTCAIACAHTPEIREAQSRHMSDKIIHDVTFSSRLKTIRCLYQFKGEMIRCDSKVEFACLDYVTSTFDVKLLERCDFAIPFVFEDITRNYVPDFRVTLSDNSIMIVEAKCEFIVDHLRNKWRYYYETIPFKREALQKFCDIHGYTSLYFNKGMHRRFYDTCVPILV